MKRIVVGLVFLIGPFFLLALPNPSMYKEPVTTTMVQTAIRVPLPKSILATLDKATLLNFFKKYPYLKEYQSEVNSLYQKRKYTWIWHDNKGLIEFAHLLYSKVNRVEEEGLESTLPYKDQIDGIFDGESTKKISKTDTELKPKK